ncbi:hypothetical protein [Reyranella soli]|uniref:Uncharacterized protein n=1 Tax=Reyranella soli TaxID=1230389 RepID=A0A512NTD2_9HYPH|nr:hypothetical protein [Reyranella soli]GEP62199.1 hypothetical protein RSO01_93650 [Reyranella soli]
MNERYPEVSEVREGHRGVRTPALAVGKKATTGPGFYAAVVSCPHCQVVINVIAEPNAIAADVVRRLLTNKPMPAQTHVGNG